MTAARSAFSIRARRSALFKSGTGLGPPIRLRRVSKGFLRSVPPRSASSTLTTPVSNKPPPVSQTISHLNQHRCLSESMLH